MQEIAFDYFTQTFEGVIKDHKQRGKYDSGVTNITGQSIVSKPEHNKVVHKCPTSGAETNVRLVVSDSGVYLSSSVREDARLRREPRDVVRRIRPAWTVWILHRDVRDYGQDEPTERLLRA